ncbi:SDR family NAD(P)-dependent oxidoreductase [Myxosarcina sp. GI1]|uniref:SDR family NAD(P)-dependent oxidoreductase n=1 Tax=Myxosarcina sp. GI1 TaxID=1541065 RepID=UPI000562619B|nr:SDR family NAD(P)-dependent oxidoreductase [Myxosarcina sp. GI1]
MKTVIITGGNSGLGYYCAQEIANNEDWQVIIACRNLEKATQAVEKLKAATNSDRITAMLLDLASLDSIRQFAKEFAKRELPPLGAIVCNAGVQFIQRRTYTEDGFETTFGVNHLGHFLLVNLLLKQITPPARIIFVSSDTHDPDKITGMPEPHFRDPKLLAKPERDPDLKNKSIDVAGRIAYTTSKLCNILCAYELSRRLTEAGYSTEKQPITVNVFNPGLMPGSGLAKDYPPVARFIWYSVLPILQLLPVVNGMKQSGKALAKLVLDRDLENVTRKYFSGFKMTASSKESSDRSLAKQLWQGSIKLTELKPEETILKL